MTANPMISVADIQSALRQFLRDDCPNRDINGFLKVVIDHGVTWRTAPKANVLAMVSPLFAALAPVIQNGVAPGMKLEKALAACDTEKKCNFTSVSQTDFTNSIAEAIKMLWMDFRTVKTSSEARRRCYLGASHSEVEKINQVLELMTHLPWNLNDLKKAKAEEAADTPDLDRGPPIRTGSAASGLGNVEKEDEYESLTEKFALDLSSAFDDIGGLSTPSSLVEQVRGVQRPSGVTDLDWDMLTIVMDKSTTVPMKPARILRPMKRGKGKGKGGKSKDKSKDKSQKGKGKGKAKAKAKGKAKAKAKGKAKAKPTAKRSADAEPSHEEQAEAAAPVEEEPPVAGEEVPAPIADEDGGASSVGGGGGGKNDYWKPETEELRRQYREMGWGCSKCRWKGVCATCYSRRGEEDGANLD